jgi:hypothetical protein
MLNALSKLKTFLTPLVVIGFMAEPEEKQAEIIRVLDFPRPDEEFAYPAAGSEKYLRCEKGKCNPESKWYSSHVIDRETVEVERIAVGRPGHIYIIGENLVELPRDLPFELTYASYVVKRRTDKKHGTLLDSEVYNMCLSKRDEEALFLHLTRGTLPGQTFPVERIQYPPEHPERIPKPEETRPEPS